MTDRERSIFIRAIERYGVRHQQQKLLEEMAELQKEICKHWDGAENYQSIAEEIADVAILLDQMQLIFRSGGAVQEWRLRKTERLADRLRKEEEACRS